VTDMHALITSGFALGLAAGIAPGPLTLLVARCFIERRNAVGVMTAFTPALTDLPILLSAILLANKLGTPYIALSIVALLGAVYLAYESRKEWTSRNSHAGEFNSSEIGYKAIITNLLNPNPYFFWISVGVPTILSFHSKSISSVLLFFITFVMAMAISKIALGLLLQRLSSKVAQLLKFTSAVSSLLFAIFSAALLWQSIEFWRQA
jgi:threonine/homoserine/homoserine lactone efflux protein